MSDKWQRRQLADVAEVTMGRQRSPKHASGSHVVPYLRAANVKDGRLELDDVLEMNFTPEEQEKYRLRPGDVLLTEGSGSRSQVGASAAWNGEPSSVVCFQNTLLRLRARPGVSDPRFLEHWARHAHRTGQWAAVATGTNILHIGAKRAQALEIHLPPLDEQVRIAETCETAEAFLLNAVETHRTASAVADALRAELFGAGVAAQSCELREVVTVTNGRQRSPRHAHGDHMVEYVRAANVKDGELVLDQPMRMNFSPAEQERYKLEPGDVLVTEGCGSRSQIGASCEWNGEVPGVVCFQNHLLRLRSAPQSGVPQRLVYHWALWAFRSGRFGELATGTNILSLGVRKVGSMPFPVLDADRQGEVLALLDGAEAHGQAANEYVAAAREVRNAVIRELMTGEDHFDLSEHLVDAG